MLVESGEEATKQMSTNKLKTHIENYFGELFDVLFCWNLVCGDVDIINTKKQEEGSLTLKIVVNLNTIDLFA